MGATMWHSRRFCCATEAQHTAGLACSYMEQEALYNAFHLLDTTDSGTIQSSDLATIFGNSLKPSEIEGIMKEAKTRSAFLAVFVVRMQAVCFQARARDTCDGACFAGVRTNREGMYMYWYPCPACGPGRLTEP